MGDVGDGVVDLGFRQGATRPIGEAGGFIEIRPGDRLDQIQIGGLLAETADHRRDLGVEERRGNQPAKPPDDFDVLTGGMEHLDHVRFRHEREKRR